MTPNALEIFETKELVKKLTKAVDKSAENGHHLRRRIYELDLKVALLDSEHLDLKERVSNLVHEQIRFLVLDLEYLEKV